MQIDFKSSPRASLGVEWELMLVDRDSLALSNSASEILAELAAETGAEEDPHAKHELFENTVEIITDVCTTVAEARADLRATLVRLHQAAAERGLAVACAGTHPFADWTDADVSPDPRYHQLIEDMQWAARRLLIFGVHIHVGVRDPEKAIAIANALCEYIPHFLALSASSPFWRGYDTGLTSVRSKIFESLPTAGLPFQLHDWDEFEEFMGTLVTARAIETIREIWWDIRPHPRFGTVELRMCDGLSTLTEVSAIAALAQSLVHSLDAFIDRGYSLPTPPMWVVRENKWRAVRHGLDAEIIVDGSGSCRPLREVIADLTEELAPLAARLGCSDELGLVDTMITEGPGYARQREVAATGGVYDVVEHLISELEDDAGLRSPVRSRAGGR